MSRRKRQGPTDDTARALGAAGGKTITIAGKECTCRPLSARELAEVERICIEEYKDGYLATVARNVEKIPDASRRSPFMEEQMIEAAGWTVHDLPRVKTYDPDRVIVNADVRSWMAERFNLNGQTPVDRIKQATANALEQGLMSADDYTDMTDKQPPAVMISYSNWWITGAYDGMIAFAWVCFRDNGVTRDDVAAAMSNDRGMLTEIASQIELLSAPAVGNG